MAFDLRRFMRSFLGYHNASIGEVIAALEAELAEWRAFVADTRRSA